MDVLPLRDYLKVGRTVLIGEHLDACAVAAKVVRNLALWDRANEPLETPAVCPSFAELPVAVHVDAGRPYPTRPQL
jgi:hypothetical protein